MIKVLEGFDKIAGLPPPKVDFSKGGGIPGYYPCHLPVFSGKRLFELKATYGLPLDVAVGRILAEPYQRINWAEFIDTARSNGWWDFQTLEVMEVALVDAGVHVINRDFILHKAKQYIMDNPLVR